MCRQLTDVEYEEICEETLNSITEKFEELTDCAAVGEDFDVNFSVGFCVTYCTCVKCTIHVVFCSLSAISSYS